MAKAPLALRLAARELRAGVRGFGIFLACIALGVGTIAAAGSTAQAFRMGLASQAREIVGGDLAVTVEQRQFTPGERAALARIGQISYAVAVRAMAEGPGGKRALVELRGVSRAWPLTGRVELAGGRTLRQALAPAGSAAGAAVEKSLIDKLGLRLGERFEVGNAAVATQAVLLSEPDRLARGFMLGPTVLVRLQTVQDGGFLGHGLPFSETARLVLPPGETLADARSRLRRALAAEPLGSGYRIRDRNDAAPGVRHLIDQLEYFLGFVGLASLVAGGLGVAGAVTAHLEASKGDIAILKVFGAGGTLVRDTYLVKIGVMAAAGTVIGLAFGAAIPPLLGGAFARSLPVPALFGLYPGPLIRAGAFGLFSAAAFGLIPLGRARSTPPSVLLRRDLARAPALGVEALAAAGAALALCALAFAGAPTPVAAAVMIGAAVASFALLSLLGWAAMRAAGRLRERAHGPLRMGLASLAGPRSAAVTATASVGLGVALVTAVVLIQSSLLAQVAAVAPRTAPALVFTEIPAARAAAFDQAVAGAFGRPLTASDYLRAPFATGRIIRVRGRLVDRRRIERSQRWAYDNDISLSALGPEPPGADVVAGRWWSADYAGPPLAALSEDAARGAAVKVGDTIGVAILGREIDAKVAALRKVDYAGFGANFPLVLDPAALAGADLANVAIAKASPREEARVTAALGRDFPSVDVISVRDQLKAAADLFGRLTLAIRAVAAIVAVAGLLVLVGAIAAGANDRARQAAILKVLGATRAQILAACAIEYGAIGLIAGIAGVGLGYLAAWPAVVDVFRADWTVDWPALAVLAGAAPILAAAGGVAAAARALAQRPAPILRTL
jgi:putative ABC transport system permease protein